MIARFLRTHPSPDPEAPRERRSGVLLHPTSLPGPYGIGDLGPAFERFAEWSARAGQSFWQVLPLGPPAYGGAPYACLSSFAGNPMLLSPELLRDDGLLDDADLASVPDLPGDRVDFGAVGAWKESLLRKIFDRFRSGHGRSGHSGLADDLEEAFARFRAHPAQAYWLDDWARFAALKRRHEGRSWAEWSEPLARADSEALEEFESEAADEIEYHRFVQFLFDRQWRGARDIARSHGLQFMGDLPIYVAHDSADVWAHRHLFDLDDDGRPLRIAGVPPDYFSETGQRWGNPLYRWDRLDEEGYTWWIERLRASLRQADIVRLDHFRAFADYWEIPAEAETAIDGHWRDGPGLPFFEAVRDALGDLPLVAEDLGELSDAVHALRRALDLPGMRVLQFGFGEEASEHTPHRFEPATVVYTGTHDNDTVVGWYTSLDLEGRDRFHRYTSSGPREVHWTMIRTAHASVADLVIAPIQDVLGLGTEARFNIPGATDGDFWSWRLRPGQLDAGHAERLREITATFERLPPADPDEGDS